MPPPLALLLCTAFVAFLLRVEGRASAGVSGALWIPTAWMLLIASKPLAIWFGMTGSNEAGSLLDQLALGVLIAAALVVISKRNFRWRHVLRQHVWLVLLLAYMFLSTFWSDITLIALRRWIREGMVVLIAIVIVSEPQPRLSLESLLRRTAYILMPYSLLLIKYYPALGRAYARWSGGEMWIGVTLHKNTLGRLCLITGLFLLWTLYRRWREHERRSDPYLKWADICILLLTLHLLKGEDTYSATSLATGLVGISALMVLDWLRKLRIPVPQFALAAGVLIVMLFGTSQPFLGGTGIAGVSSTLGRDHTLTGRTETWEQLAPVVASQPLLGVGFGSFWTTERREFYRMSHAHNGYLDTLLELGTTGLAFYAAWLLASARKFRASLWRDYPWAFLSLSLLIMSLVYNYTESALNSLVEPMTAVMVLASIVVPYEPNRPTSRTYFNMRLHLPSQRVT